MSNQAQLSDVEIAKARDVSILDVWARLDLPGVKPGKAFCSSFRKDKNPSCELGGAKNIFYDHTTKESLDSIALVRKVKNCSFQEAVAFILGKEALPPSNGRHPLDWGTFLGASTKKPVQVEPAPKPKFWSSLEVAAQECERLPLASADSAAVDFFMREYGLPVDCIPANWCVLVYHGQRGIVYPGVGPDGAVCAYKFKSLSRDARGKRPCVFLSGAGGAILFPAPTADAPLVIAGGEEKGAAAWAAGFAVLAPLTGEGKISNDWVSALASESDQVIVFANDADQAGERANKAGADQQPSTLSDLRWRMVCLRRTGKSSQKKWKKTQS